MSHSLFSFTSSPLFPSYPSLWNTHLLCSILFSLPCHQSPPSHTDACLTQNFGSESSSLEVNIKPLTVLPRGEPLWAAQIEMHANKGSNASLPLQGNNWYSNLHPPNTIYLSGCNEIFNMLLLYVSTCFIHSNLLSVSLNQLCTVQLDSFPYNYPNMSGQPQQSQIICTGYKSWQNRAVNSFSLVFYIISLSWNFRYLKTNGFLKWKIYSFF